MSIRGAFDQLIGKRIKGVVAKESAEPPREQVFILFADDTYFEFYGNDMRGCSGVARGNVEAVKTYMREPKREITFESVDESISDVVNSEGLISRIRDRVSKVNLAKISPGARRLVQDSDFIEAVGVLLPEEPVASAVVKNEAKFLTERTRRWISNAVLLIGSIFVYDNLHHPVQIAIREWGQTRMVADVGATVLNAAGVGLIVTVIFYLIRKK